MISEKQRHLEQLIYFEQCYYFYPWPYNLPLPINMSEKETASVSQNKTQLFRKLLGAQLQYKHKECYVKEWTEEQDQMLIKLGQKCRNWRQLSMKFDGKSAKVCHRRYLKLIRKQERWPKEDEETIKRLKEVENKSWVEIEMSMKKYNAKKIREHYKNYLQIEVSREKWTLEDDLQLWNQTQKLGRAWSQISKVFPTRSCLQIRNRYYKFLEPIIKKIENSFNLNTALY